MLLPEQLQLSFERSTISSVTVVADRGAGVIDPGCKDDVDLAGKVRELLIAAGAFRMACEVRVEWNARLKTCAGHVDYRRKLISLNPRLREHGFSEIDRTLRHELAHLLAQFRAGRRRILPHGPEWRAACHDLGIGDEKRCHNLPFPRHERVRRFVYKCPNCLLSFPRVRRIRRAIACLACCRAHNRGKFHAKFRLQLLTITSKRKFPDKSLTCGRHVGKGKVRINPSKSADVRSYITTGCMGVSAL